VSLDPEVGYFSMYEQAPVQGTGHVALELRAASRRAGLSPSARVWDFTSIALAVTAADHAATRASSPDGWTRAIELDVHLREPAPWVAQRSRLESMLRFLTGDFWTLHMLPGGEAPPIAKTVRRYDADSVCLLSGGMDSLVGAIDLLASGRKPLLVSQLVRGDAETQRSFASALGRADAHLQLKSTVATPGELEISSRARSLVFFAFAALAATALRTDPHTRIEIVVPENGFISLNVPLGPGRIGSQSTKTTHPAYVADVQALWDAVGIQAVLSFPYRYKTKGEILRDCADATLLTKLLGQSSSCGKASRIHMHCGQCLPCMVRRAAFLRIGLRDTTVGGYRTQQLAQSGSRDVGAAASAFLRYKDVGIRRFVGGHLSFAGPGQRQDYEGVVARGLEEIGNLLHAFRIV
jgi:7-cyano-7-deazaguanine synthase in queuosine biosynthesis